MFRLRKGALGYQPFFYPRTVRTLTCSFLADIWALWVTLPVHARTLPCPQHATLKLLGILNSLPDCIGQMPECEASRQKLPVRSCPYSELCHEV